jgi:hypothetical protein
VHRYGKTVCQERQRTGGLFKAENECSVEDNASASHVVGQSALQWLNASDEWTSGVVFCLDFLYRRDFFSRAGCISKKCLEESRSRVRAVTVEPGLLAWKARAAICCKSHILSQHEERATRGAWKISVTDDRFDKKKLSYKFRDAARCQLVDKNRIQ